jgi:hypothetical protein
MATVTIDGPDLVVRLSPLGKLAAFHGNVRIPLTAVQAVDVEPHPWAALRGIRAPGTGIPGVIAYGTRRHAGGKDFAAVLGRRPAVRIELGDPSPFARLVVSVPHAEGTDSAIRAAAGL